MTELRSGARRPARTHGWVLPVLVVALVAVPIAEVYLLVQVGRTIGVGWTVLILIAEALLGGWLMRREGNRAWTALNKAIGSGRMPAGELTDAALVLVGGMLLLLPGFVTDLVGLIFLLPFTRPLARQAVAFFIARRIERTVSGTGRPRRDDVIEGETVEAESAPTDESRIIRGEVDPS